MNHIVPTQKSIHVYVNVLIITVSIFEDSPLPHSPTPHTAHCISFAGHCLLFSTAALNAHALWGSSAPAA